jgi:hypothetical protein
MADISFNRLPILNNRFNLSEISFELYLFFGRQSNFYALPAFRFSLAILCAAAQNQLHGTAGPG